MPLVLYLGNKNCSSWSMRAWLALVEKGVAFKEELIDLTHPERTEKLARLSPAAGVPILEDGEVRVFDSLAIMEYVNEAFPGPPLLPAEVKARARARSFAAWMHSGFPRLRAQMTFESTFHPKERRPTPDREADAEAHAAARAFEEELRRGGPYLFGELSLADLAFVPLLRRLSAYEFPIDEYPRAALWAGTLLGRASVRRWLEEAERLPPFPLG